MSLQTKKVQFDNQPFYLGIDVHKKSWHVTIRTHNLHLKTFAMEPSPQKLKKYVDKNYPGGIFHSVYEAGFSGYWADRELRNLGIKNIIVNPADVPTTHKEKDRKRDAIDSNKLSREHCNSSLRGIFVVDEQQESVRSIARLYRQYTKRSTQIKNRIKGLLNFTGHTILDDSVSKHWSAQYIRELKKMKMNTELNRLILDEHIDELEHARTKQLFVLRKVRALGKQIPIVNLLRTIPGVGLITSFMLYAELVDIKRFRTLDHLCSFIGLVPSTSSSGSKERVHGISQRQNRYLRSLIIEAAWIASRVDPVLTQSFLDYTKRMKKQNAIIRIAKKLTNRIRYVWLHNKPYVPSVVA